MGKWRRDRAKAQLEVAKEAATKEDWRTVHKAAKRTVHEWPLSDYAPEAQQLLAKSYEARGDDDRAFHDHPWWFITIPFEPYLEQTPDKPRTLVKALRPHFRSATHQHIVQLIEHRPVWTLILTGSKSSDWGFWHEGEYTPHEEWLAEQKRAAACEPAS